MRRPQLRGPARTRLATAMATGHRDGLTVRQIARHHGRTCRLVLRLLKEAGVKVRAKGGAA